MPCKRLPSPHRKISMPLAQDLPVDVWVEIADLAHHPALAATCRRVHLAVAGRHVHILDPCDLHRRRQRWGTMSSTPVVGLTLHGIDTMHWMVDDHTPEVNHARLQHFALCDRWWEGVWPKMMVYLAGWLPKTLTSLDLSGCPWPHEHCRMDEARETLLTMAMGLPRLRSLSLNV